jgi:hypothetical protein
MRRPSLALLLLVVVAGCKGSTGIVLENADLATPPGGGQDGMQTAQDMSGAGEHPGADLAQSQSHPDLAGCVGAGGGNCPPTAKTGIPCGGQTCASNQICVLSTQGLHYCANVPDKCSHDLTCSCFETTQSLMYCYQNPSCSILDDGTVFCPSGA